MSDKAQELADKLDEFGTYLTLDGQEGRAKGYERAARNLRQKGYTPPDPARVDGIGESIRSTITSYQRSGEIEELSELKDEHSWFESLRQVNGIGPARAKELHHKFRVKDVDDLLLVGDDVEMLSGVGEKTRKKWMQSARQIRDKR